MCIRDSIRSCFFIFVVNALVIIATNSIIIHENIFSGKEKLNSKYGNVKAKFTAIKLISEANIPHLCTLVTIDTRKTAITNIIGAIESILIKPCNVITIINAVHLSLIHI